MRVSTAVALLAAAGAAAGQGATNASAKALGGAKQQLLLAPVVQYLGASPCGGDIALPAATTTQGTILLCADRLDWNLQLTLSGNTGASAWTLFIAWGDACLTGPTGVFEYEVSALATAANPNPFLTGFCLTNNCCGAYACASPPCNAATLSVDYTAPSTAVCDVNNRALDGFPLSSSKVLGLDCINVANNYKISFTLSNPGVGSFPPEQVSVFTASGDRNCGTNFNFDTLLNGGPMPPGFTPSASVIASNSNSFQLTSLCTAEPCCAIVWCHSTNIGFCGGMRYALTFDRTDAAAAALAAGVIAAIVVSVLLLVCCIAVGVYLARRSKSEQPQQQTVTMVVSPGAGVSAWGQPVVAPARA